MRMNEPIKHASLQFFVQESLCCSNCRRIPLKDEIVQCSNGHIICELCYPKYNACATCQVDFGKEEMAPIKCAGIVMDVLNGIPLSCFFKEMGCKEPDMNRALLREHLQQCEFRNLENDTKVDTTVFSQGSPSSNNSGMAEPIASSSSSSKVLSNPVEGGCSVKCNVCGKTLPNAPVFFNHYKRLHGEKKKKSMNCPICGKHFHNTSSVFRHIGRCHNKGKNENAERSGFFCPFCQDRQDDKIGLTKHLRQHHREDVLG